MPLRLERQWVHLCLLVERAHRLVTFASTGGFGELPYRMGPFGGGWICKEHSWTDQDFQQ
jgi:hypothetical protein